MAGRIKVSSNGKLFFSRVVTSGRVQKAFKEKIGDPVGKCMSSLRGTHPGKAAVQGKAKSCTQSYKGTHIL